MKTRAFADLCQLSDADLFAQISEGASFCIENAKTFWDDAETLFDANRYRGAHVLLGIAKEEAAKCLILVDAVRCPPSRSAEKGRLLSCNGGVGDHLARMIYAALYDRAPTLNFTEIREIVENERASHYFGGDYYERLEPNYLKQQREANLYVDYIEDDGKHRWWSPKDLLIEQPCPFRPPVPNALGVALALADTGCLSAEGLRVVADVWRPVPMTDNLTWQCCCELNGEVLLRLRTEGQQSEWARSEVKELWRFPLWSLDLRKKDVSAALKAQQPSLREGALAYEAGYYDDLSGMGEGEY